MIQLVDRNGWRFVQRPDKPYVVGVIGITSKEEVLFVKQWRESVQQQVLDIPSGVVEPGEQVHAAAKREFLEETGYQVSGEMEFLGQYTTSPGIVNERLWLYAARCKFVTNSVGVDDERIELVSIPMHALSTSIWTLHNYGGVLIDIKAYLASIYAPKFKG